MADLNNNGAWFTQRRYGLGVGAPIAWQDFLPLHLSNWIHNGRSIGRTSPIIEVNSND